MTATALVKTLLDSDYSFDPKKELMRLSTPLETFAQTMKELGWGVEPLVHTSWDDRDEVRCTYTYVGSDGSYVGSDGYEVRLTVFVHITPEGILKGYGGGTKVFTGTDKYGRDWEEDLDFGTDGGSDDWSFVQQPQETPAAFAKRLSDAAVSAPTPDAPLTWREDPPVDEAAEFDPKKMLMRMSERPFSYHRDPENNWNYIITFKGEDKGWLVGEGQARAMTAAYNDFYQEHPTYDPNRLGDSPNNWYFREKYGQTGGWTPKRKRRRRLVHEAADPSFDPKRYLRAVTPQRCRNCGADLTEPLSVSREYVSKSGYPPVRITGKYTRDGDFESRESGIDLTGYDLELDSDICTACMTSTLLNEAADPSFDPKSELMRLDPAVDLRAIKDWVQADDPDVEVREISRENNEIRMVLVFSEWVPEYHVQDWLQNLLAYEGLDFELPIPVNNVGQQMQGRGYQCWIKSPGPDAILEAFDPADAKRLLSELPTVSRPEIFRILWGAETGVRSSGTFDRLSVAHAWAVRENLADISTFPVEIQEFYQIGKSKAIGFVRRMFIKKDGRVVDEEGREVSIHEALSDKPGKKALLQLLDPRNSVRSEPIPGSPQWRTIRDRRSGEVEGWIREPDPTGKYGHPEKWQAAVAGVDSLEKDNLVFFDSEEEAFAWVAKNREGVRFTEAADPGANAKDYLISDATAYWHPVHLLTTKEVRQWFKEMGFRTTSLYRRKRGSIAGIVVARDPGQHQVQADRYRWAHVLLRGLEERLKAKFGHGASAFVARVGAWEDYKFDFDITKYSPNSKRGPYESLEADPDVESDVQDILRAGPPSGPVGIDTLKSYGFELTARTNQHERWVKWLDRSVIVVERLGFEWDVVVYARPSMEQSFKQGRLTREGAEAQIGRIL